MDLEEREDILNEEDGCEEDSDKEAATRVPDDLRILEAVLFASDELITAGQLKTILPGSPDARKIRGMVEKINIQLQKECHPFEIVEIGGGYQFRTITYYHPWVRQIFKEKAPKRLSTQALECLAVIAYKQPISKAEIEAIRGVVSDGAMKTLLEKRLITIAARSEKPGRPLLYGTTQEFLKYFGLNKIDDLPRIEEFEAIAREKMEELDIDEISQIKEDIESPIPENEEKKPGEGECGKLSEETSVFEVKVTPSAEVKEQLKDGIAVEESIDEKPSDAGENSDSKAEVETMEPVTVSAEEEETFEIKKPDSVNESAIADGKSATQPETTGSPLSQSTDTPPGTDNLKPEAAIDIEEIASQERPPEAPPQKPVKKIKREYVEGAALRGETAYDLEAPVIDELVNQDVEQNNPYEKIFAQKDDVAESDAISEDSEPSSDSDDFIKDVSSATSQSDDESEVDFEIKKEAFTTSDVAGEKEQDSRIELSRVEKETVQKPPEAVRSNGSDTAYFEVKTDDLPEDQFRQECENLAEELKETSLIMPDNIEKSSNESEYTDGKGKGTAGSRKKSKDSGDNTVKKENVESSSTKKPRPRRRRSGPDVSQAT